MKNKKWPLTLKCAPNTIYTIEDCSITQIELDPPFIKFLFADGVWDVAMDAHTDCPAQLVVQLRDEADALVSRYHKHRIGKHKWCYQWCSLSYPSIEDIISALNRNLFEIEVTSCLSADRQLVLRGKYFKGKLKNYIFEFELLDVQEAYICFQ